MHSTNQLFVRNTCFFSVSIFKILKKNLLHTYIHIQPFKYICLYVYIYIKCMCMYVNVLVFENNCGSVIFTKTQLISCNQLPRVQIYNPICLSYFPFRKLLQYEIRRASTTVKALLHFSHTHSFMLIAFLVYITATRVRELESIREQRQ